MTNATRIHSVNHDLASDESLAQLAQQGNKDAFNMLYERLFNCVYRRVRYTIPERDVEDVTQEVFIAVIKSLKSYRGEAKFRTWIRTLVSRQIADYYRHRKSVEPDVELNEEMELRETSRTTRLAYQAIGQSQLDDQILLRQCLRKLPDHYREVILLRFVDGLPFNEIAELQQMSLEAAKSQFRRAIAALQTLLEVTGYER